MPSIDSRLRLKRVAIFQMRSLRFRVFFSHVVLAKPLHTFARHASGRIMKMIVDQFRDRL